MTNDGRYIYCITDSAEPKEFGKIGIRGSKVHFIAYREIGAVVSSLAFQEMNASIDDLETHQRVIEAARKNATVLPVKFGVVLRHDEGVLKLLTSSYAEYRAKLNKLQGRHEYGIKILLGKDSRKQIQRKAMEKSDEIRKLQEQIAAVSGKGSAYFLEMKLDDAKKNETFREMEGIIAGVNDRLMSYADDRRVLKSDLAQIIFNASYLVNSENLTAFKSAVGQLKQSYHQEYGLTIHMSGPWAAYSFC